MEVVQSKRLQSLPPYLFIEIDRKKRQAIAEGRDIINLGVGDPDQPTPSFIVEAMREATGDPANHRYPFDEGVPDFRQEAAKFLGARFSLDIDPDNELITTIGSKDGISHLPLAVVNPGEVVLVPQPGYPVYQASALFAGAEPYIMPLREQNDYLPDLGAIPGKIAKRAALMFLNYPNNPTAAVADRAFYEEVVAFARRYEILVASDAAYCETYFDERPMSMLEVAGAKELTIEFHSLSKTFNMTGWRLGFAVGNAQAVGALARLKGNMDSGQFNAIQWAGVKALANWDSAEVRAIRDMYRQRRDVLVDGLTKLGWQVRRPQATFYVWIKCPGKMGSMELVEKLLDEADVVSIPGNGFGSAGEG
ncbi:MAG: LL-diaminopimelate aminotransferase, partial [Phycisphaerae bacterium]|nr:LL-diaminopimelate aminotransferase [Phycisphaerae bacterium]